MKKLLSIVLLTGSAALLQADPYYCDSCSNGYYNGYYYDGYNYNNYPYFSYSNSNKYYKDSDQNMRYNRYGYNSNNDQNMNMNDHYGYNSNNDQNMRYNRYGYNSNNDQNMNMNDHYGYNNGDKQSYNYNSYNENDNQKSKGLYGYGTSNSQSLNNQYGYDSNNQNLNRQRYGYGTNDNQNLNSQYGYNRGSGYGDTSMGQNSDQKLTGDVQDSLHSAFSDKYNNVHVSVQGGYVTLTGTVESQSDKKDLEEKVSKMDGVRGVNNQVTVQNQRS